MLAGCDMRISKPIEPQELGATIGKPRGSDGSAPIDSTELALIDSVAWTAAGKTGVNLDKADISWLRL
jgi:hypothetical protein